MNYKKVIEDYANGTINPKEWTLVMDNDGGYWRWTGKIFSTEEEDDEVCHQMNKKYGVPDGYHDIVNVLRAAGIECEWC